MRVYWNIFLIDENIKSKCGWCSVTLCDWWKERFTHAKRQTKRGRQRESPGVYIHANMQRVEVIWAFMKQCFEYTVSNSSFFALSFVLMISCACFITNNIQIIHVTNITQVTSSNYTKAFSYSLSFESNHSV